MSRLKDSKLQTTTNVVEQNRHSEPFKQPRMGDAEMSPHKTLLFLCNILLGVLGIPLAIVGILSLAKRVWFDAILAEYYHGLLLYNAWAFMGVAFLVVGALVIGVAGFGCVTVRGNKHNLLSLYLITIGCVLLVSAVLAIIFIVGWTQALPGRDSVALFETVRASGVPSDPEQLKQDELNTGEQYTELGEKWQELQFKNQCCGYNGPQDYEESLLRKQNPDMPILPSCCVTEDPESDPTAENMLDWEACKQEALEQTSYPYYLHAEGCVGRHQAGSEVASGKRNTVELPESQESVQSPPLPLTVFVGLLAAVIIFEIICLILGTLLYMVGRDDGDV